jgi:predicted permease
MSALPLALRSTARRLASSPSFTLIALVTLGVAIGVNVAIFSLVNTILLRPLPYDQPGRLVGLWHAAPGLDLPQMPQSPGTYLHYRQNADAFEDLAIYATAQPTLTGEGSPERLEATRVSASLFSTLRVPAMLGRHLRQDEQAPGSPPVIVLSHGLWQRRFAGDRDVIGRSARIDGIPHEIVGVMPRGFAFPRPEIQAWLPLEIDPANVPLGAFGSQGIARLAPGVDVEQAKAELDALIPGLVDAYPEDGAGPILLNSGLTSMVRDLREDSVGDVRVALWILLGAVAFILLIACANVANLFLVRAEGRHQEIAVRSALGESRLRLFASFLLESGLLALGGGLLGLGLAAAAMRLLGRLAAENLPRLHEQTLDSRVLGFTVAVSILAGLLFGTLPALRLLTPFAAADLGPGGSRATAGRKRLRVRKGLVVGQVALACILLIASALSALSFRRLSRIDPGFRADDVLTFDLALPDSDYPDLARKTAFHERLLEELTAVPGVEVAGVTSGLPLSQNVNGTGHALEDFPLDPETPPPVLYTKQVSERYFDAMGIELQEGRLLSRGDVLDGRPVAVVSAGLATFFWPEQSAVGKRLRPGGPPAEGESWVTIVGVVEQVRDTRLQDEPRPLVYYPLRTGEGQHARTPGRVSYALSTHLAPTALAGAVRDTVWRLDANLPISDLEPMTAKVERSKARLAFSMMLLLIAAGVAIVLGSVGLYGVVSYTVSQRVPEIAIRMALGARGSVVSGMFLREGMQVSLLGIVLGVVGAAALTRLMQAMLFEVDPLEPAVFALVPLIPLAVALLSSYLPASRAARVAPAHSLRHQ